MKKINVIVNDVHEVLKKAFGRLIGITFSLLGFWNRDDNSSGNFRDI